MEDKKKAVLYARTSTDREEQKLSFNQQRLYQDDRFKIEKVFDDRVTGTSLKKRVGLIELLKYVVISIEFERDDYIFRIENRTNIEVVICSSTSRLGRNTKDVQRIIDILKKNHIKLYFIDINSYSDNEQIEILLNIYFTLDQQYSK